MSTETKTNTDDQPEQQPAPAARFYSLNDAAAILDVHPSTLSRQCANGTMPHVKVGRVVRIPIAEIERLERGEAPRTSVLSVPDYETDTPSMFEDGER